MYILSHPFTYPPIHTFLNPSITSFKFFIALLNVLLNIIPSNRVHSFIHSSILSTTTAATMHSTIQMVSRYPFQSSNVHKYHLWQHVVHHPRHRVLTTRVRNINTTTLCWGFMLITSFYFVQRGFQNPWKKNVSVLHFITPLYTLLCTFSFAFSLGFRCIACYQSM